jgi:hypothetical protein
MPRPEAAYYILNIPLVGFALFEHIPWGRAHGWRHVDVAACFVVVVAATIALLAQWKALVYFRLSRRQGLLRQLSSEGCREIVLRHDVWDCASANLCHVGIGCPVGNRNQ